MKYTITINDETVDVRFRFRMADEAGKYVLVGPCGKKLAKSVLPDGYAGDVVVVHNYDLVKDDCEEHTTRRFKGA